MITYPFWQWLCLMPAREFERLLDEFETPEHLRRLNHVAGVHKFVAWVILQRQIPHLQARLVEIQVSS
jgi:hypothetical protein